MSHPLFTQRHAARPTPVPPLPHPSWQARAAGASQQSQTIDAQEFWQRLGL